MLTTWLSLTGVEEQLAGYSAITGLDLIRLGTTADADEIKDTAIAQPLIVALGLVAAAQLDLLPLSAPATAVLPGSAFRPGGASRHGHSAPLGIAHHPGAPRNSRLAALPPVAHRPGTAATPGASPAFAPAPTFAPSPKSGPPTKSGPSSKSGPARRAGLAHRLGAHASLDPDRVVVAGHSVGELTAAAVAGALTPGDAVAFAARRGAQMAAACSSAPTGMAAVLGGDPQSVLAAIEAAGLTAANRNGAGQIVAAGPLDALARLADNPPPRARVRLLPVAGAFHTAHMRSAEEALAGLAAALPTADPTRLLLSNADGAAVRRGHAVTDRLARQVTRPVRWDLCQQTLADLGVSAAIELAPAGALTALARRQLPGVELLAVTSPGELDQARRLIAARTQPGPIGPTGQVVDLHVAVAPTKGVFTRATTAVEGRTLTRGTQVGTIHTNRDEHPIVAPFTGVLAEWLRRDGDIVGAGLPVARLTSATED